MSREASVFPSIHGFVCEKPRLLDRVRSTIRICLYSRRTERAYVGWARRFIRYHNLRHPEEMGRNEGEITVRYGKGIKDRGTMLSRRVREPLKNHLDATRGQHEADLRAGRGTVELPNALAIKYPCAASQWSWQWVFPATRFYRAHDTGNWRRQHAHSGDRGDGSEESIGSL